MYFKIQVGDLNYNSIMLKNQVNTNMYVKQLIFSETEIHLYYI